MRIVKEGLIFLLAAMALGNLYSESLYGAMSSILSLGDEPVETELYLEEMTALTLVNDNILLEGIEIILEIPSYARQFPNHAALYCYSDLTTPLSLKSARIKAKRQFMHVIPSQKRYYFYLPVIPNHNFVNDHESYVHTGIIRSESWPVVLSLMPIAKGIPGKLRTTPYKLTITPIYRKKSLLDINIGHRADDEVKITLNGDSVDPESRDLIVDPGMQQISITSAQVGTITDILDIEKGKKGSYTYDIVYRKPTLRFDFPDEFSLELDGKLLDSIPETMDVMSGIHNLKLTMGQYSLEKQITVKPGENYLVSFFMDIHLEKY